MAAADAAKLKGLYNARDIEPEDVEATGQE
jgi:hypothetical protein